MVVARDPCVRLGGARPRAHQPAARHPLLPQARLLIILAVALVVFVWACGCAPPPPEGLHGRAAFDAWIVDNGIREQDGDLSHYPGQPCGGYLSTQKLAIFDAACMNRNTTDPAAAEFVRIHELGHAVDIALAFPQGANPVGFERGAQCVATVVLGYSYAPPSGDAAGYWDCPDDQIDRTRILMEAMGAW